MKFRIGIENLNDGYVDFSNKISMLLLEIFTLNTEEDGATETSGYTRYTAWCKNPQPHHLNTHYVVVRDVTPFSSALASLNIGTHFQTTRCNIAEDCC
jgi:hypothetical protein